MAYKPTRMEKIRQIMKFYNQGVPLKKISRLVGVSRNTVRGYVRKIIAAQIDLDTEEEALIKQVAYGSSRSEDNHREVEFAARLPKLVDELSRVGVTLHLLWEEYKLESADGFCYSRFCKKVKSYKARQDVTLRLEHKAADVLSVDYAGKKTSWVDKKTGEIIYSEVLVCTMPYSGYMFAVAVASQRQEDFIQGINQALLFIGGVPKVLLSDNLKSFVTRADRYEPKFSELCIQLSSHYGIELNATRAGRPKDKAHVERHVNILYNQVYGPLRNDIFHSIEQINLAFIDRLETINKKPYQGKSFSRHDLFVRDEKPHLKKLPSELFEIKKSTRGKVQRNYHVILGEDKHQYSVPYIHVGQTTDIVYTSKTVEVYLGTERIAVHKRDRRKHAYSTLSIHMPEKHIKYWEQKGWDATYFKSQAQRIGENTVWAITAILQSKVFIEQTYNACLGVLRLAKTYTPERLENACRKAKTTHRVSYGILKNILKNNMDKIPDKNPTDLFSIPRHDNIRGASNYS